MELSSSTRPSTGRVLAAISALTAALALVAYCLVYPHMVEPDLVPPGLISILWLWLSSPLVAVLSGFGISTLLRRPVVRSILIALAVALLIDLWLVLIALGVR